MLFVTLLARPSALVFAQHQPTTSPTSVIDQPQSVGDLQIKITSVTLGKVASTNSANGIHRQQIALVIQLVIRNTGKNVSKISVLNEDVAGVILTDDQGGTVQHMVLPMDFTADDGRIADKFLAPGGELTDTLFFEPPPAASTVLRLTLPAKDLANSGDSLTITMPASDIRSTKEPSSPTAK